MPIISIRFIAGRYHATPWGRHVNEAAVEWPPSPWRLLRALIASGFNKLNWQEIPNEYCRLFEAMASTLPTYRLPRGQESHSRHYMPIIEGKNEKPVKVFDAFIRFKNTDAELLVYYPEASFVGLDFECLLKPLLDGMSYLGRAESWVEAKFISGVKPTGDQWTFPAIYKDDDGLENTQKTLTERIDLIAPISALEYQTWYHGQIEKITQQAIDRYREKAESKQKKVTDKQLEKEKNKAIDKAPCPPTLIEAMCCDTSVLQKHGWSSPPGSKRVVYLRPRQALQRKIIAQNNSFKNFTPVEAVLLAIASNSESGRLLPKLERGLPLAEKLHQAAVSKLGLTPGQNLSTLTGKDNEKMPLRGHSHAHFLPLCLGRQTDAYRIDHVLVWAKNKSQANLCHLAQKALMQIRQTYAKGMAAMPVAFAGSGSFEQILKQLSKHVSPNKKQQGGLNVLETAHTWESYTPFVPRLYLHKRGPRKLEQQIINELAERHFPIPKSIKLWPQTKTVERGFKRFIITRKPTRAQPPMLLRYGLTLTFDTPVAGPICLGYASHYGLGIFTALKDS